MKAVRNKTKKYYKYYNSDDVGTGKSEFELTRTPIFLNNETTDGVTIIQGGEHYAMTGINAYLLYPWYSTIIFDLGEHCKNIQGFGFIGHVWVNHYPSIRMQDVYGSADGENWEVIKLYDSSSTYNGWFGGRGNWLQSPFILVVENNYRFLKFTAAADDTQIAYNAAYISEFTIWYTRQYAYETSSSNYDFYREVYSYKGCTEDAHKLLKSYEKGQYYGN